METHRLALPPGYRIESYEIVRMLGKGGFGITYEARDIQIGRLVAIKELLPDSIATRLAGSTVVPQSEGHEESWQWARERFVDEARILAGFRHPNIIAVHRIVEANGTVYLIMDCIEGESYEARLRRIGREPDQVSLMAVIAPLLDGLQEVHDGGLLHRDIKPENILFDKRGNPVLIDFGAARSSVGATMTMTSIVTHGYSPAEQYQTKGKMGPWTDIYAVGAVMCRAITGEKPPVASDRIMEDNFHWLSSRQLLGFSSACLQAVDWALRVRPEDRPKSIAEWETCFEGLPRPEPIERTSDSTAIPTRRIPEPDRDANVPASKRKSQFVLIAVVATIVMIGTLLATAMFIQSRESEKRAEAVRLAENQKAVAQLREVEEAAAKSEAARKAEEQARLALEAEAARKAAEEETAHKREAEEQSRLVREAEAERNAVEEQARISREAEAAQAEASKNATKEFPFDNSLGMKFVPVPGTDVLFSMWATRVKDYAIFVEATNYGAGTRWTDPGFQQTPTHPVVNVSWDDAKAFCRWLTEKERAERIITSSQEYRLPTDAEWSVAVGSEKYPWGNEWPPPKGVANYRDSNSSPVGSFSSNKFGLYDMGGNVWQWCEDWYRASMNERSVKDAFFLIQQDNGRQEFRVLRGASCGHYGVPERLLSSVRIPDSPDSRLKSFGLRSFRCVLGPSP